MTADQLTLLGPPRPSRLEPGAGLADTGRDAADGYWTPDKVASACVKAMATGYITGRQAGHVPLPAGYVPKRVLEPSVGGGAWVRAIRQWWGVFPSIHVRDIDPEVPGLFDPRVDEAHRGDWLESEIHGDIELTIGNPPYSLLMDFIERGFLESRYSAWLLRATFLGSKERAEWHKAHRPRCVWVVSPRCKWEGPGGRPDTDVADPVFVLYDRDDFNSPTRLDWLSWR